MYSKISKVWMLLLFCICLCVTANARELSDKEMMAITGKEACPDCHTTGDDTDTCKEDNPCASCQPSEGSEENGEWTYVTPAACPYDSLIKKYYPGATVKVCKVQVVGLPEPPEPTKYCHEDADDGTEHDCYRKYYCTSVAPVKNITCDESTTNPQCAVDKAGAQCRRCKLGNVVEDLEWHKEKDDLCLSTPPS